MILKSNGLENRLVFPLRKWRFLHQEVLHSALAGKAAETPNECTDLPEVDSIQVFGTLVLQSSIMAFCRMVLTLLECGVRVPCV